MNAGKVNGWWVVAAAAIPIWFELMTDDPIRAEAFLAFAIFFGIMAWFIHALRSFFK